ncbi:hypothetical protein AB0H94_17520 [Streptomyces purpurascens]|uniref:hypothetical protein n=1 Tax=Streptomyces purpurascens TaxID=1924 RepID=UPI0033E5B947
MLPRPGPVRRPPHCRACPVPPRTPRTITPAERAYRDRSVLDEPHNHLVDFHRELAKAKTGVTFYLRLLNRLSSGEFDVDDALFTRIDRTVDQLEEAAEARDAAARTVLAVLEPIEAAAAVSPSGTKPLSTDDQAALLAIAGGAKLYEHLLTGRMSVTAASGTRASRTPSCSGWRAPA